MVIERIDRSNQFGAEAAPANGTDDDCSAHRALERIHPKRHEVRKHDRNHAECCNASAWSTGSTQGIDRRGRCGKKELGENLADHCRVENPERRDTRGWAESEQHDSENRERQIGNRS